MDTTTRPLVGIVLGSNSDLAVMEETGKLLQELGVSWEMSIASAHRSPELAANYARTAEQRGLQVIIAGAGMAAHLPGVLAAYTILPVIGVPLQSGALNGQDAMLAMVQMPPGVPVATVAIGGARNAALLAVQILARQDPVLREKLRAYKLNLADGVVAKNKLLQEELGHQ